VPEGIVCFGESMNLIVGATMATMSLSATTRTNSGKGAARKIRALGQIPAIIYRAGQPATSVSINPNDLENAFRRTGNRNTLVDIGVDGKNFICLVKHAQREPGVDVLLHVDFYEVSADEAVNVVVPVRSFGKSLGEVAGGRLHVIRRDLTVRCKPGDIPESVDVDITNLEIGDFVRVSGVTPPAGAEIISQIDFNVVTILGKREDLEVEEEVVVEDTEATAETEEA
jgi:large subunit ribosomal protein L25